MNERLRSQKGFVAITLITVLAIAFVIIAYAALLNTFTGGQVVVGTVAGNVWYSTNNAAAGPWTSTLTVGSNSSSWYSMVNFTSGYTGQVKITWQLEKMDTDWANVSGAKVTTTVTLTGSVGQPVYASGDGSITTNRNWSQIPGATVNGEYRIEAYIETTS
jgi:hypothetical protein